MLPSTDSPAAPAAPTAPTPASTETEARATPRAAIAKTAGKPRLRWDEALEASKAANLESLPPSTEVAVAALAPAEAASSPVLTGSSQEGAGQAAITITGCLERTVGGDQFRLTDTEGSDAPKARGWRSGFLKKRPAPVALLDPPDPVALRQHVGRRVVATGQLTNRDLRLRTLESTGSACE